MADIAWSRRHPMAVDLEAIKAKWLNQCGPRDYGMPEYGCSHPAEDYRPVMLDLVREVERLCALTRSVELYGTGFIWRRPNGEELVLDPAEVTVVMRACPDPDGHRTDYEHRELTAWKRAVGKAEETASGVCPWCGGRLP